MKFKYGILPSIALILASSVQAAPKERIGLHGMVMFSDGASLYASHLPMFHAPHDVQFIAQILIQNQYIHTTLIKTLTSNPSYWTLSPERFDLNQLGVASQGKLSHFKADLFSGHFERGGLQQFADQTIELQSVIIHQSLNHQKELKSHFIRLTPETAQRQFYARVIQSKPGVDLIFWVESNIPLPKRFSIEDPSLPFDPKVIALTLGLLPESLHKYYEEFGDLQ